MDHLTLASALFGIGLVLGSIVLYFLAMIAASVAAELIRPYWNKIFRRDR